MPKQFQLAHRSKDQEPLDTFEIPVPDEDNPDKIDHVETFRLFKPPDSAGLMAVNLASRFHKNASEQVQLQAISAAVDFLGSCMDPGEYRTFYELLVSPQFGMETDDMLDLCKWAVETVTARPTKRSTGSRGGRQTAGTR